MTEPDGSKEKVVRLVLRAPAAPATPWHPEIYDRVERVLKGALDDLEDDRLDADDRAALASESCFIRRFGFDACRARRLLVLEFKHQADLTDREIRQLYWLGSLSFQGGGVRIHAPLFIAAYGWCLVSYFALLMGLVLVLTLTVRDPSMLMAGRFVAFELLMLAAMGLAHGLYIHPRKILSRSER
ncbi:MAG: hypothetical protein JSS45_08470 [Proteobacteria bacterium]|nr:hypothetical protein [Pseudomonadota bacterium]MBS0598878.1 hypothetical protein [Pseudomonadota bacterium]